MEREGFWRLFKDRDRFADFTPAESQALFELLVAATFVDNQVTNRERLGLMSAMDALPHMDDKPWEKLGGDSGTDYLVEVGTEWMNPGTREAFFERITSSFTSKEAAQTAFDAVINMLHADGLQSGEFDFCIEVGQRLGLDEGEIRDLVSLAWALDLG